MNSRLRGFEIACLAGMAFVSACEGVAVPTDAGVDGAVRLDLDAGATAPIDAGPSDAGLPVDAAPSDAARPDAARPPGDVAARGTWTAHCGDPILGTECSDPSRCGCTTTTVVVTSGACGLVASDASQTQFIFRGVDAELIISRIGLAGDPPVADPDCQVFGRLFSFPSLDAESLGAVMPAEDQCDCVTVRRVGSEVVFSLDCAAAAFRGSTIYDARLTGEVTLDESGCE